MNTVSSPIGANGADLVLGAHGGISGWWYAALEQRPFLVDGHQWITHVVGIHRKGADRWIQLDGVGSDVRSFIVRVSAETTIDEALAAVERGWRHALPLRD